jgi:hypothetical protein
LGNIGIVPRAYDVFRAYEGMEGNKNKEMKKYENLVKVKQSRYTPWRRLG